VALQPSKPIDTPPEELVARANALRTLVEGSRVPTTQP